MNKLSFLALLIAFVVGGAFAADTKTNTIVTGTVVSYTAADTAKKTPAVLVLVIDTKNVSFVIDAKTVLVGKDKKALDLATLKAGDALTVEFTVAADKSNTAVSVTAK